MRLDEFISETILSIIKSINDSKDFAEKNGAIINPIIMESGYESTIWRKDGKDGKRYLTKIDFDIAVVASNKENNGNKLQIEVAEINDSNIENEINKTSSRIKFSLNVALPHQGDK